MTGHHGGQASDGAECVEMQIATKARLCGEGFHFRHSFAIFIRRADGERIDIGPRRSNMSPQWSRN